VPNVIHFNSALFRIAAVYHRLLKIVVDNRDTGETVDVPQGHQTIRQVDRIFVVKDECGRDPRRGNQAQAQA
jgi:hypothetical protein